MTPTATNEIIAVSSVKIVEAIRATIGSSHDVITSSALDLIVASNNENGIVSIPTIYLIITIKSKQHIVTRSTEHYLSRITTD